MEKTTFIGLTVLDPNESIYADNSAFITRDRREIDRGLHIGIKTHRHDGSPGLSNPLVAPSGLVIGSGGTIPGGISLTLGYTLEDAAGGETLISPTTLVTTPNPLEPPLTAPTAVASYLEGELDVDTFTYAVTWSDGEGGETPLGPSVTVSRDPGFANGQIELDGLDAGMEAAGAVEWRLYRARSGGVYVLLATGSTAKFTDDGETAAQCDVNPPTFNVNTTGSVNQLQFSIPAGSAVAGATFINLYASQAGDFAESCLLAQVPVGSAGASPIFSSLELLDAQPPDVNRSYGGANQIDPDTELIDYHWKRPVETVGDLPEEAEEGDVRAISGAATPTIYIFLSGEWQEWEGAGGAAGFTDDFPGEELNPEWTSTGSLSQLEVADLLTPVSSISGIGLLLERGPRWADGTVAFMFHTGAAVQGSNTLSAAVEARRNGSSKIVVTYSSENGLIISTRGPGEDDLLVEAAPEALKTNTDYWMKVKFEENLIHVEIYEGSMGGVPFVKATGEITDEEAIAAVGKGVKGNFDWWLPPVSSDWSWDDFKLLFGLDADDITEGMGVIVIPTSEKGLARPSRFKQYTWYCKEEPTNLGEFDTWIEEGP